MLHLRAGGVSVVLSTGGTGLPEVLYWGPDLGQAEGRQLDQLVMASKAPFGDNRIDVPERISILPTPAEGWVGYPGLLGSRRGAAFSPLFELSYARRLEPAADSAHRLVFCAVDSVAALAIEIHLDMSPAGLLRLRSTLTNTHADSAYDLQSLVLTLPVPTEAAELLDFTGRHSRERIPVRSPFNVGTRLRESRKGKPGADSSYLLIAGASGFGFTHGETWGVHLGWSGNQVAFAERSYNGLSLLGAGELLLPGEIRLQPGQSYSSPTIFASYGNGLNQLAARLHAHVRQLSVHPAAPRPVVVNTWEAVYFDQQLDRLLALAEAAASVGAERFVLDDGWFTGRRSDRSGLGDWFVDEKVWPGGLQPLIDKVSGLGMDFGLWIEPEMINLDSDLARAHPDWILRAGGRTGIATRNQYVLDLGNPAAYAYIAERLHDLLNTYDIAALKWDHNRTVVEAGHGADGTPGVHNQTLAVYGLMAELRRSHPKVEIESCAAGGGRMDLGIAEHTTRVWPSDCLDPLERQQIQRFTQLVLPPELMGTHLGAPQAHTTLRTHDLDFRAGTAVWGHFGIEWNLTDATPSELARVGEWIDFYKQNRALLHTGRVVVIDHPDPVIWVHGVVSADRDNALFGISTLARSTTWPPGRLRLPELTPQRRYRVAPTGPAVPDRESRGLPEWWHTGVEMTGRMLATAGVQLPAMYPERTRLLSIVALD